MLGIKLVEIRELNCGNMRDMIYYKSITVLLFVLLIFSKQGFSQTNKVVVRQSILKTVEKLRKEDMVHLGNSVGVAGIPETNNKYYKLYLKLKAKATNDELAFLSNDSSKCIVIYSFSALRSRNYAKLKDVFLSHVNDTTLFWTAGGCTGFTDRVNWFMLRQLKPLNPNDYLSQNEYEAFCNDFKKKDNDFISE